MFRVRGLGFSVGGRGRGLKAAVLGYGFWECGLRVAISHSPRQRCPARFCVKMLNGLELHNSMFFV